jgi:hypothetical protein
LILAANDGAIVERTVAKRERRCQPEAMGDATRLRAQL